MAEARKKVEETVSSEHLRDEIIHLIQDKKGKEIISLDLRKIPEAVADFFILCNGNSNIQVQAIIEHVKIELKKQLNEQALSVEGMKTAEWALVDYGNIVVHAFQPKFRELYGLEDLWSDAIQKQYDHFD